ncbi:MAG: hypothetical protein AAF206_27710 [Bacteroidota bacterium]
MKNLLLLSCLVHTLSMLHAQETDLNDWQSRNLFLVEGGGQAVLYAIKYERRYAFSEHWRIAGQIGISPFSERETSLNGETNFRYEAWVPIAVMATFGEKLHHAEFGLGMTIPYLSQVGNSGTHQLRAEGPAIPQMILGYRLHPPIGGFVFRLNYVLHLRTPYSRALQDTPNGLMHWFGISMGAALKNANVK